jgi:hypothetical protein
MAKNATIARDLRKNALFLAILAVGSIPQILGGYSNYLLVLLIPAILYRTSTKISMPMILCLAFGLFYTVPLYLHKDPPTYSTVVFFLLYPWLFYMIPTCLVKKFRNPNTIYVVLTVEVICLALWSICVNVQDAVTTGQFVNVKRVIDDLAADSQSATNHNMMLAMCIGGVGMLFAQPSRAYQKHMRYLQIIAGLFALFAAFHLLNRTALVLAVVALFIGLFIDGFSLRRMLFLIGVLVVVVCAFVLFLDNSEFLKDVILGFESRESSTQYGMATAGARDVRWLLALKTIPFYPLGTDAIILNGAATYAHNTWLDCGVQSGWIALALLITITVNFLTSFFKFLRLRTVDKFHKTYCAILVAMILLQMAVEPVIQSGAYQLFLMLFFMWSIFNIKVAKPSHQLPKPNNERTS